MFILTTFFSDVIIKKINNFAIYRVYFANLFGFFIMITYEYYNPCIVTKRFVVNLGVNFNGGRNVC